MSTGAIDPYRRSTPAAELHRRTVHGECQEYRDRPAPNLLDPGFVRRLEAEVSADNLAIAERENWNFKTKRVDGCYDLFDRTIILAEIAAVRRQPRKGPNARYSFGNSRLRPGVNDAKAKNYIVIFREPKNRSSVPRAARGPLVGGISWR
jgi:hypothetical protein